MASVARVCLIRGDGIGPEIADATLRVLEAAGARVEWTEARAGLAAVDADKDPLPQRTLDLIDETKVALKGPLGTPVGRGFRSVNVALRQHFDLYANLRPVRTIEGVPSRYTNVDLVIVRENTEDLYAGVEHYVDPRRNAAESISIITRYATERVARYALDFARLRGRKRVTVVHKANILKLSQGLFLDVCREVARDYADIKLDDMIVDATCMKLVVDPTKFDVIVTTNMFGDIVSDLTAGLVGGLGVAPGGNIGLDHAIFEAVHGTAPDIAGKGVANPTALLMSACMMLDHLHQNEVANRVRDTLMRTLPDERARTGDLGGKANTRQFTDALISNLR